MLVAQNSLGPVCPVPLTVRGKRAHDEEDDRRRERRLVKFLPIEWLVDVPLAVAAQARKVEYDRP